MASIDIDFPHGPKTVARTFTATGTYTPQGTEVPVVQLFDGTTALTPAGMVTVPLGGTAPFAWSASFNMGADCANATLVAKLPTSGVTARENNITVSGSAPVIITPPGGGGSPSFGKIIATLDIKGKKPKGLNRNDDDDEQWVMIDWPKAAVSDFAGTWTGEQAEILREITRDAYRIRDEEKAAEFPE